MPNPLRGEASFQAGDVTHTLIFDINVFCTLEDETGLAVSELIDKVRENPSFKLLRSIFCAGLQSRHPQTTLTDAGRIMSDVGLETMKDALSRALQAAMPAKDEVETAGESTGGKGRRRKVGTGSPS